MISSRPRSLTPRSGTALAVLWLAASCGEPARVDLSSRTVVGIDSLARRAVRSGPIAGLGIAVGYGGRAVFTAGYGFAMRGVWVPITQETVFPIGQISESFAAAAALRLVERGALSLDAPASTYLPELVNPDPAPAPAPTLRHLLTHTSGLWDYRARADSLWFGRGETRPLDEIVAEVAAHPLRFPPGADWSYSSTDFLLVGMIVERATGSTYGAFLTDELLQPLGLFTTYVCADDPQDERRTTDYIFSDMFRPSRRWGAPTLDAGTGLCSNADDLVRWEIALLNGAVVSDSMLELMLQPIQLSDGRSVEHGIGAQLDAVAGVRRLRSTGMGLSPRSALAHYPDLDLTIAVLFNTEGSALTVDAQRFQESLARLIAHLPR